MGKIYAAYGSNMNLPQMRKRCPKAKVIGVGKLKNYRLTFRGRNKGVANIEETHGREVPILLWEITKDCERALNIYEGFPNLYIKKNVDIETKTGKVEAMVYIMVNIFINMPAEPHEYYFKTIWDGYKENNITTEYLKIALAETKREVPDSEEVKRNYF